MLLDALPAPASRTGQIKWVKVAKKPIFFPIFEQIPGGTTPSHAHQTLLKSPSTMGGETLPISAWGDECARLKPTGLAAGVGGEGFEQDFYSFLLSFSLLPQASGGPR